MGDYYYGYEDYFGDMAGELGEGVVEGVFGILLIYLMVILVSMVISLALYILQAIGLYKMGKSVDVGAPWLSFIPIANVYALGRIAQTPSNGKKQLKYGLILLLLYLGSYALIYSSVIKLFLDLISGISYNNAFALGDVFAILTDFGLIFGIAVIVSLVYTVFYYIALYKIYKLFASDNAAIYLVLSILLNVATPIMLFCLRGKTPQGYASPMNNYNMYGGGYVRTPYQTIYPPYAGAPGGYQQTMPPQPPANGPEQPMYAPPMGQYGAYPPPMGQHPGSNVPPPQYGQPIYRPATPVNDAPTAQFDIPMESESAENTDINTDK